MSAGMSNYNAQDKKDKGDELQGHETLYVEKFDYNIQDVLNIQFQISEVMKIIVNTICIQMYCQQSSANFIDIQTSKDKFGMNYDEQNQTQSEIKQKRYKFYLDIRKKSRDQIINTMRYRMRKQEDKSKLNQLILITQQFVEPHQLDTLIDFAKRGNHNAVIHIGNMLLQKKINQQAIQEVGITWMNQIDGNSGYYQWLLMIFLASGLVTQDWVGPTQKMIDLLICSKTEDQFRITYCLKCLNFICKFDQPKEFLTNLFVDRKNLGKIMKLSSDKGRQIVRLSWRLANHIFNQKKELGNIGFLFSYGIKQFFHLIQIGLNSIDSYVRILACQVFCNNVQALNLITQSHIYELRHHKLDELFVVSLISNTLNKCLTLTLSKHEDSKVKVQMSYILTNYITSSTVNQLVQLIDCGLFEVLHVLEIQLSSNLQVKENTHLICARLKQLLFQIQDVGDTQLKRTLLILQHADILQDEQQIG